MKIARLESSESNGSSDSNDSTDSNDSSEKISIVVKNVTVKEYFKQKKQL